MAGKARLFLLSALLLPLFLAAEELCPGGICPIPADVPVSSTETPGHFAAVSHGYLSPEEMVSFLEREAFGGEAPQGGTRNGSFWWMAAAAFLAGLALNLSPCVLPMIPVQLAVLGLGAGNGTRKRRFALGLSYGGGMAAAYGALGAAAICTGGFLGKMQSSPLFQLASGCVFVFLTISVLGVVHIDFSKYGRRAPSSMPQTGLFLMGALQALLAGACVAPAVLAVILQAAGLYSGGNRLAVLLPLVTGMGMGFPWPFLGAGISSLPKPGKWMMKVRYLFAAVILAMAIPYFGRAFGLGKGGDALDYRRFDAILSEAFKDEDVAVVDFYASWCTACKAMDKTLSDKRVAALLDKCAFFKIRVEDPGEEEAARLLDKYGIKGFPAILVIRKQP